MRFLVPPEGELSSVEGIEEARAQDGVLDVRVYREPGHVFGPFRHGADRAGAISPLVRAATTRSSGPIARPLSYALRSVTQELSSKRRETMLGFQPPAIGDEEIAAVTETLRSGWLTTGPRTAELEERFAEYVGADTCSPSPRAPRRSTSPCSGSGSAPATR